MTRIYVLYGQGGWLTSFGMSDVARFIQMRFGGMAEVTEHQWSQQREIAASIATLPDATKVILIGHSLGANGCAAIANGVRRGINLIVAYDPSWLSAQTRAIPDRVARCILYRGSGFSLLGHAQFTGKHVETINVADIHELMPLDKHLLGLTIKAVDKVVMAKEA